MNRALQFVLLALLCGSLRADVLILKDGTKIEGDVKRTEAGYVITSADGKTTTIDSSRVESIRVGKSDAPKASTGGADRLASLRRSVESLNDPKQVIDRYKQFIEMNKGTPAATDAIRDLATWQERLEKGLVKVSGKWITPEERDQLVGKSSEVVAEARDLVKSNRLHDAEPMLQQAVELDPKNAAAWYLTGVLLYRQDKIPAARKAFESANTALPNDAATLNNLGVILWRQNQFPGALNFYDQAMLALPGNKEILNNVAEALVARREDPKRNTLYAKVGKRFAEQDTKLQAVMAQYGWYRWGSSWVDQPTMEHLRKTEKDIQDKIDALEKEFATSQVKINENLRRISDNQRLMQDIDARSYGIDGSGRTFRIPYPDSYYSAQRDNDRLAVENRTMEVSLRQMQDSAKRIQQQLPTPKFTGVQRLIDVEGMPRVGTAPTTEPAGIESPTPMPGAVPDVPSTAPTTSP